MTDFINRAGEKLTPEHYERALSILNDLVRDRGVNFAPLVLQMEQNYLAFRKAHDLAQAKAKPSLRVVSAAA